MNDPINKTTGCIGNDPHCPCQDGDTCHYRDIPGSPAMPIRKPDIVERLWESDAASALTNQAAREIERLRAELEDAKADIAMLIQKATDAINGK